MNYSDQFYIPNPFNKHISPYERKFYITLMEYHQGEFKKAIDIGCGLGMVTIELADYFDEVIGIDKNEVIIKRANKINKDHFQKENVKYILNMAEQLDSIKDNSVDMITCGQACHDFQLEEFYEQCERILKPGGTLAIWLYVDPHIIDSGVAVDIFQKYYYSDYGLGTFWSNPSIINLRSKLEGKSIPSDHFTSIIKKEYHPKMSDPNPDLSIHRIFKLREFVSYLKDCDAYKILVVCENLNIFHRHQDIFDEMLDEFKKRLDWDLDCEFNVIWDTMYIFGRKK